MKGSKTLMCDGMLDELRTGQRWESLELNNNLQ